MNYSVCWLVRCWYVGLSVGLSVSRDILKGGRYTSLILSEFLFFQCQQDQLYFALQALKILRSAEYAPYVVFIASPCLQTIQVRIQ